MIKGSHVKLFPHCARNLKPALQSSLVRHDSPNADWAQAMGKLSGQVLLQHGSPRPAGEQLLPLGRQVGAGVQVPLPVHLPVPLQAVPAATLTQVVPWST